MKLLKLVTLFFAPLALCATITQANTSEINENEQISLAKQNLIKIVGISVMQIQKQAQGTTEDYQLADNAALEFTKVYRVEDVPTNLKELYGLLFRANLVRYDPTSSYAKQILDILGEIFSDILSTNQNFLQLLISPTPENLRDIVTTVVQILTKPIQISANPH